jgi:hypothetical protein
MEAIGDADKAVLAPIGQTDGRISCIWGAGTMSKTVFGAMVLCATGIAAGPSATEEKPSADLEAGYVRSEAPAFQIPPYRGECYDDLPLE